MMFYGKFCVAALLTLLVGFSTPLVAAEPEQEWRFRVTLNDKDIGYHHFSITQEGELDMLLWYSENDQWLALETVARGGRTLRYELM